MELILNPCGIFWWSPEGPVSQIHSPHLHVGAPGIFSDLLRSVKRLKREWGVESNGKLLHYLSIVKLQSQFLSFRCKTWLWSELQPWFLSLQWRTCPWAELILQPFRHFTYVTTHSPTLPSLYLRHSSFSNPSIDSPTSEFILQPFFCFSCVKASSLMSPGEPLMFCRSYQVWFTNKIQKSYTTLLGTDVPILHKAL